MTTQEFSDAFDTLLNTYNTQSRFGEAASKAEIALDEYEKSVFLTQAQDQIVKSYFDARLNSNAQGMDDSERRQVDFSTLITDKTLTTLGECKFAVGKASSEDNFNVHLEGVVRSALSTPIVLNLYFDNSTSGITDDEIYDDILIPDRIPVTPEESPERILYNLSVTKGNNLTTINITFYVSYYTEGDGHFFINVFNEGETYSQLKKELSEYGYAIEFTEFTEGEFGKIGYEIPFGRLKSSQWRTLGLNTWNNVVQESTSDWTSQADVDPNNVFDERGVRYVLPSDILFILNEKLYIPDNVPSSFVVKPLHYREYDREMSKAYAQPLKKQVWRLFYNTSAGYDITSELIPSESLKRKILKNSSYYKIRYIKRPNPIILVDLPNGLNIDGHSEQSECGLNSILHQDILNEAFRLAITTRGGTPAARQESNQRRRDE